MAITEPYRLARPAPIAGAGLLLLAASLFLSTGCPAAVRQVSGPAGTWFQGEVSFVVEPEWEITRNYRWLGGYHVMLTRDDPPGVLTVELLRAGRKGLDIPLDLVAEGVVGEMGRGLGVETAAMHRHDVALAGHRAVALSGVKIHGPQRADFSTMVARLDHHLLVVSLQAPEGELHLHTHSMEHILWSLRLGDEPPRDGPLWEPDLWEPTQWEADQWEADQWEADQWEADQWEADQW